MNIVVTYVFKSLSFVSLYYYTHENLFYIIIVHSRFNGGSRAAAASKMECFESIINALKPSTVVTKSYILNDAGLVIDLPLKLTFTSSKSVLQPREQCFLYLFKIINRSTRTMSIDSVLVIL